jgi:hypothetical protein
VWRRPGAAAVVVVFGLLGGGAGGLQAVGVAGAGVPRSASMIVALAGWHLSWLNRVPVVAAVVAAVMAAAGGGLLPWLVLRLVW